MKRTIETEPMAMTCQEAKIFIKNLYPQFTRELNNEEYNKLEYDEQLKYNEWVSFVIYAKC